MGGGVVRCQRIGQGEQLHPDPAVERAGRDGVGGSGEGSRAVPPGLRTSRRSHEFLSRLRGL